MEEMRPLRQSIINLIDEKFESHKKEGSDRNFKGLQQTIETYPGNLYKVNLTT